MLIVFGTLIGLAVGVALGVLALRALSSRNGASPAAARREAEATRREAEVEARELAVKIRAEVEQEVQQRRAQVARTQERLAAKEEELERRRAELAEQQTQALQMKAKALEELEAASGLTVEEAKRHVLARSQELGRAQEIADVVGAVRRRRAGGHVRNRTP